MEGTRRSPEPRRGRALLTPNRSAARERPCCAFCAPALHRLAVQPAPDDRPSYARETQQWSTNCTDSRCEAPRGREGLRRSGEKLRWLLARGVTPGWGLDCGP